MDRWRKPPISRVVRLITIPVILLSWMVITLADRSIPGLPTLWPVSGTTTPTTDQSLPPGSPGGEGDTTSSALPTARDAATLTDDIATGVSILVDGYGLPCTAHATGCSLLADAWAFDGQNWAPVSLPAPPPRFGASMVYDAANQTLVLFGGQSSTRRNWSDTWIWNGTSWTQLHPPTSPSGRYFSSMAYDAATRTVVLFGGCCDDLNRGLNDTWIWNGTTWTEVTPSATPPGRYSATIAYDATTQRVVLFGGCCAAGQQLGDTWTWNGSTWTRQHPAMSPPPRRSAAMDYDAATGRVILFGGNPSRGGFLDDTWSWDGANWTNLNPATKPPGRYASQMTYEAAIQSMVLFGGYGSPCLETNGACTILDDTWVFNGTTWTQQSGPRPVANNRVTTSPLVTVPSLAPANARHITSPPTDWLQFGGDQLHMSDNTQETTIDSSNVNQLQKLFQVSVPSSANDAPVYLSGVTTPLGVKDLLLVSTEDGHILALDAQTGSRVWSQQYGPGTCQFPTYGRACFSSASPAIDPNRQYVYSYGLDGYVHKFRVGDGSEVTGGGWPELVTLKPSIEKESSSLAIGTTPNGTSFLYVTTSSAGDTGDYQGHLTTINLSDGSQQVLNALCSNQTVHFVISPGQPDCAQQRAGIWGRFAALYDPATEETYVATGNGDFSPSRHDWGETILALNPDGAGNNGNPLDSYTPTNYQQLTAVDLDFGSTSPVALPVVLNSVVAHLAIQGGKDSMLRLLNLDNLNGHGAPGFTGGEVGTIVPVPQGPAPQGTEMHSEPAIWVNQSDQSVWVFVTNENGASGLKVTVDDNGIPTLKPIWHNSCNCTLPTGNSPFVANGVVYVANPNDIEALDPLTGTILWQDSSIGGIVWQSPIVVNGVLYIADSSGKLTAYTLPATGLATRTPTPTPPQTETATASATPTPTFTPTPSATRTSTSTQTSTTVPTATASQTSTPTPTPTQTETPAGRTIYLPVVDDNGGP